MKIAVASDIHLEFGDLDISNTENAEVLILSGDIMIAADLYSFPGDQPIDPALAHVVPKRHRAAQLYRDFLFRCSREFSHVIYVAGNHEFYHFRWYQTLDILRDECTKNFSNVHFLENDTRQINGVTFIGCSLWTDMNKKDPYTLYEIEHHMNDFSLIRNDRKNFARLKAQDTVDRHVDSLAYIRDTLKTSSGPVVMVGHHAPSRASTHPRYQDDSLVNGAYSSDLSELILDHPQIVLWTHGHTHNEFDYKIGNTRIVCNPRGYIGYEEQAENFSLKYLDI